MIYAYIRVSTECQSYEGQRYEIQQWSLRNNVSVDHWIEEKKSGKLQIEKRSLGKLLRKMKKGDTLVTTELSRLGRNMMMVMSILNTCSQKGVHIHSIKDNFELTDSLNAKIIAFAFSLAAEIERNLISQRTREALAAKRQAGVKLGRPMGDSKSLRKFKDKYPEIQEKLRRGASIKVIAEELNVHRNTLSRYLKTINNTKF